MTLRSLLKLKSPRKDVIFFTAAYIASLVMAVAGGLYTFVETGNPAGIAFSIVCSAPLLLIRWNAGKKLDYSLGHLLVVITDGLLLLPFGFFMFGGSYSGMPVCFFMAFNTAAVSLKRNYRRIAMGTIFAVICILFFLEGRFPELVAPLQPEAVRPDIILAVICGVLLCGFCIDKLMNDYTFLVSSQIRSLEGKNNMYKDLLERESDRNSFLRKYRHDVHHYNNVLLELLESGHYDKAISYLKEFDSREFSGAGKNYCVNLTLNSILNYMDRLCARNGIVLEVTADVAENIPVSSDDLSVIAANLLENAVNGTAESGVSEKRIQFRAVTREDRLVLCCENPCRADLQVRESMPVGASTGIESILAAIGAYDGTITYEKKEQRLNCSLLLNLKYL